MLAQLVTAAGSELKWMLWEEGGFQTYHIPIIPTLQMVSEKVGGAEGTKLDEDFKDLERVTCKFTSQENVLLGR